MTLFPLSRPKTTRPVGAGWILVGWLAFTPPVPAQENFLPDTPVEQKEEAIKYTLILPGEKAVETVREGERNPYSKSDSPLSQFDTKGSNEENEIRERLTRLRVVGVSPGVHGLRVMLGDMVLEPGVTVPQLLPEQTVSLRVGNITPRAIELVWVEKKPSGLPPRVLTIPVDLRPYVRTVLKGQANERNQWEKENSGVAGAPVIVSYPAVAQTPAHSQSQMARNDKPPQPQQGAGASPSVPSPPPPVQGSTDAPATAVPVIPEWEEAMKLLNKLVPLQKEEEKK